MDNSFVFKFVLRLVLITNAFALLLCCLVEAAECGELQLMLQSVGRTDEVKTTQVCRIITRHWLLSGPVLAP